MPIEAAKTPATPAPTEVPDVAAPADVDELKAFEAALDGYRVGALADLAVSDPAAFGKIERAVHVTFEIFCETIESMYGVTESAIVIATVTAIIRITILGIASPLRLRCDGQAKR